MALRPPFRHIPGSCVLAVALLASGCASGQVIRFEEPVGARVWEGTSDWTGMRTALRGIFGTKIPGTKSFFTGNHGLYLALEDGTVVSGNLVVLGIQEEPAEFRLGEEDVRAAARGGPPVTLRGSAGDGGDAYFFKAAGDGIPWGDSEVAYWEAKVPPGDDPEAGWAVLAAMAYLAVGILTFGSAFVL